MRQREDIDALRRMLRVVRVASRFPIVFGGVVRAGGLRLTEFSGTTTDSLRELVVEPGSGAGGRALAGKNIVVVTDYRRATSISHDYDEPVLAEGIRSVMAAPIVVNGATRMVAYAATHHPVTWGTRARDDFAVAADALAREIEIRDEADRRITLLEAAAAERDVELAHAAQEVSAELDELAQLITDESVASRVIAASRRLAGVQPASSTTILTRRETEVLELVSLGLTYADVARQLSLQPATVKTYMKSTIAKLGTNSRHQAVIHARRQGLLRAVAER